MPVPQDDYTVPVPQDDYRVPAPDEGHLTEVGMRPTITGKAARDTRVQRYFFGLVTESIIVLIALLHMRKFF